MIIQVFLHLVFMTVSHSPDGKLLRAQMRIGGDLSDKPG